ncbi:MAG: M42 family peptidase [Chloroflexota bacterium]
MATSRGGAPGPNLALLRKLCTAVAVSGDEGEVRTIVLEELKGTAGDVKVDALGNVLMARQGSGARRMRVMLDAHMDEVGFMIVAESSDGVYEFTTIGHLDPRGIAGKPVVVGRKHTPGVVGAKAIHLVSTDDLKRPISTEALRIDLGPGGKAALGERGSFTPNFQRAGPSVMSKSLDNRLGVAILIELLRHAPANVDVLAAFTVQEEIGLRGARVAASHFKPDVAIVIDATPAHDLPMQYEGENNFYNSKLGLGPAIYVSNQSAIDDPRLVRFMMETATKARIPHQVRQPGEGGTDAGAIQKAVDGIPVVSVSVPHRYPHTAMSIARLDDWRGTYALLLTALRRIGPDVLKRGA